MCYANYTRKIIHSFNLTNTFYDLLRLIYICHRIPICKRDCSAQSKNFNFFHWRDLWLKLRQTKSVELTFHPFFLLILQSAIKRFMWLWLATKCPNTWHAYFRTSFTYDLWMAHFFKWPFLVSFFPSLGLPCLWTSLLGLLRKGACLSHLMIPVAYRNGVAV